MIIVCKMYLCQWVIWGLSLSDSHEYFHISLTFYRAVEAWYIYIYIEQWPQQCLQCYMYILGMWCRAVLVAIGMLPSVTYMYIWPRPFLSRIERRGAALPHYNDMTVYTCSVDLRKTISICNHEFFVTCMGRSNTTCVHTSRPEHVLCPISLFTA